MKKQNAMILMAALIGTDIQEYLYLPSGQFEAMQIGDTVDILGEPYKKVYDEVEDAEALLAPDGNLYLTGSSVDLLNYMADSLDDLRRSRASIRRSLFSVTVPYLPTPGTHTFMKIRRCPPCWHLMKTD